MREIQGWNGGKIKAWTDGVEFEHSAQVQAHNLAGMHFIHDHIAIMSDVHAGIGATVGSVIPTKGAIIPAAVGVDIGCGMMAIRTEMTSGWLPESLSGLRSRIEHAVPHGGPGVHGSWKEPGRNGVPNSVMKHWFNLDRDFIHLCEKHPKLENANSLTQLGTLGGGNHFIEVCLDEEDTVWVMLHSGSRGIGNQIGRLFIEKAKEKLISRGVHVPDKDLAWLERGEEDFVDYTKALGWAQRFAKANREAMMDRVLHACREELGTFKTDKTAVNCHHNYVNEEDHYGERVFVTRKGAVSARKGELGIIPGSMGARSYIVEGLGNEESFCSCSHGAGRRMSRTEAKRRFTVEDQVAATLGVECRKDASVIDEIPMAYKDIDAVMAAQIDLVRPVHVLKQVLCVKG